MQVCKKCGREIRYIPVSESKVIACDSEEIEIYTETGRKTQGYRKHDCGGTNGEEKGKTKRAD